MNHPRELQFPAGTTLQGIPLDRALALSFNRAAKYRALRAWQAIHCGTVAIIAKDSVGHGKFEDWLKSDSLSVLVVDRSLRRYMAVARICLESAGLTAKKILGSDFLVWGVRESLNTEMDGTPEDTRGFANAMTLGLVMARDEVFTAVKAYVGSRGLWRIYQDEGISRERTPHQGSHPSAGPVQMTFEDVKRGWTQLTQQITALGHLDQSWADLPDDLSWDFLDAAVPVVGNLATTKIRTKAQRDQVLGNLISMSNKLRELVLTK